MIEQPTPTKCRTLNKFNKAKHNINKVPQETVNVYMNIGSTVWDTKHRVLDETRMAVDICQSEKGIKHCGECKSQ
jgi:hypothetical protein